jgi:hypothetical protein
MQVCHFHADEGVVGTPVQEVEGAREYTCPRTQGHPAPGTYTWLSAPPPPEGLQEGGLAGELGLYQELPSLVRQLGGWVEYGLVERAYALAHADDFARLVKRYGHTAIAAKRYTVSAFLARVLGDLSRAGTVLYKGGPATGRWDYNSGISYWAVGPEPAWDARLTWSASGHDMTYVPGQVED